MTVDEMIVALQALSAQGHGALPVKIHTSENGWDERLEEVFDVDITDGGPYTRNRGSPVVVVS